MTQESYRKSFHSLSRMIKKLILSLTNLYQISWRPAMVLMELHSLPFMQSMPRRKYWTPLWTRLTSSSRKSFGKLSQSSQMSIFILEWMKYTTTAGNPILLYKNLCERMGWSTFLKLNNTMSGRPWTTSRTSDTSTWHGKILLIMELRRVLNTLLWPWHLCEKCFPNLKILNEEIEHFLTNIIYNLLLADQL